MTKLLDVSFLLSTLLCLLLGAITLLMLILRHATGKKVFIAKDIAIVASLLSLPFVLPTERPVTTFFLVCLSIGLFLLSGDRFETRERTD